MIIRRKPLSNHAKFARQFPTTTMFVILGIYRIFLKTFLGVFMNAIVR